MKSENGRIRADVPIFGDCRNGFESFRVIFDQAFVKREINSLLDLSRTDLRTERFGFWTGNVADDVFRWRSGFSKVRLIVARHGTGGQSERRKSGETNETESSKKRVEKNICNLRHCGKALPKVLAQ